MYAARIISRALTLSACAAIAFTLGAQATPTPAATTPTPTVVFIAGLGDDARVWKPVISKLGDSVQVYAWDRPGYGKTPGNEAPRDPCTIANELHAALQASSHSGPFVIVGHSLGGQYAYAFARLFPTEVAGLVLVDATPVGHWAAIQRDMPGSARLLRMMKAVSFSSTMKREFDGQEQCLDALPTERLPFPSRVLVRTVGDRSGGEELVQLDTKLAEGWLTRTGATQLEPVRGSGHYIQKERPELLASVIRSVLAPR